MAAAALAARGFCRSRAGVFAGGRFGGGGCILGFVAVAGKRRSVSSCAADDCLWRNGVGQYFVLFCFSVKKGRRLKNAFSQYVPPELAQHIGKAVNMESESREISVLFSDIRSFATIAEKLTPKELTSLMNKMLTAQTRVIYQNGGTVDKFIGDSVMAFWNAPLDDVNHARNAVSAALDIRRAIGQLSDEEEKAGRSPMRLGVGICTGVANVGNMGSEFRVANTHRAQVFCQWRKI